MGRDYNRISEQIRVEKASAMIFEIIVDAFLICHYVYIPLYNKSLKSLKY